jgi:protein transport protein SEC61 subunit gamma-like protein
MNQRIVKLKSGFQQYKRVWRMLRKPSMEEFKMISKVSIIGLLIVGAFGFVLSITTRFLLSLFF